MRSRPGWVAGVAVLVVVGCAPSHSKQLPTASATGVSATSAANRAPFPRADAAMSFDPATRDLILFGGMTEQCTPHEFSLRERADAEAVWMFDGHSWSETHPAGSPDAASVISGGMVYDPALHKIVYLATGRVGTPGARPTWVTDGSVWRRAPGPQISQLDLPRLTYSISRRAVVLSDELAADVLHTFDGSWSTIAGPATDPDANWFGVTGTAGGSDLVAVSTSVIAGRRLETWTNTGGAWSRLDAATPEPLSLSWGVTVPTPDDTGVLLAGAPVYRGAAPVTWQLGADGRWQPLSDPGPLKNRVGEALTYDSQDHRVLMFGGATRDGRVTYNDTWAYNGKTWMTLNRGTGPITCPPSSHG